jgi:hypothetical protein
MDELLTYSLANQLRRTSSAALRMSTVLAATTAAGGQLTADKLL